MERRVYLDNNATSPMDPRVAEAIQPYFLNEFGNASSIHAYGQHARAAVERARSQVADLLSARPREVIFTCGGTEADNAAIDGVARRFAGSGGHVITSTIEHPAVLKSCQFLEQKGFRVTCLSAGEEGVVRECSTFHVPRSTVCSRHAVLSVSMTQPHRCVRFHDTETTERFHRSV